MHPLLDKKHTHVLIIEPSSPIRLLLTAVLRSFGFSKVTGLASGKDALALMQSEPIHWVISSLLAKDEINISHFLNISLNDPAFSNLAVSLLIEPDGGNEDESWSVTKLFEMGLFSYHTKSNTKDTIQSAFGDLLKTFEINGGNTTLTSAEYLRTFLILSSHFKSLLDLEQSLLKIYPGNPKLLLHLADAHLHSGNQEKGTRLLYQAELLDTNLLSLSSKMRAKHKLPEKQKKASDTETENFLGIKQLVLIDPDTDVLKIAQNLLAKIGIQNVVTFEKGQAAMDWINQNPEPDLIIMEWKIPEITGPALLQRIRQAGKQQVPIIIASSLVKKEDASTLKEMEADYVLEKPFDQQGFLSAIVWTIQQTRVPNDQKTMERKIRKCLKTSKFKEAEKLITQLVANEKTSEGTKNEIYAEYEFAQGHYSQAIKLATAAFETGGDKLFSLSILGKSLMKVKNFECALSCFDKANQMAPFNFDRLITCAEINLDQSNFAEAKKNLENAKKIDATNDALNETEAKIQIAEGAPNQETKPVLDDYNSAKKVSGYMNNRAIALIRSNKFDDGIALYKRTINSIPETLKELKSIVSYNLALAHARADAHDNALEVLSSINEPEFRVTLKADSLRKKIENHKNNGAEFILDKEEVNTGTSEPTPSEGTNFDDLLLKMDDVKKEYSCFQIYISIEGHDPRTDSWFTQNIDSFWKTKE